MTQACMAQILTHIPTVLTTSGRFFMRAGNYMECVSTPGMDYNAVYFNQIGNNIAMLYASLCLPVQCTADIIRQNIDALAQHYNSTLRVSFILNHIPEQKPDYDWLFYFTVFLISFLVLLVLISSISHKASENKLLSSFNIKNSFKIFKYNPKSKLNVLNGVRSLSMFWVIFGHQYSLVLINTSNILTINDFLYQWKQLIIQAGVLAVDVFFFVGGFLVAYSVLKQDRVKSKLKYPLAILNRFLRFIPSYFVAILMYYSIMPHLIQGPFTFENTQKDNCSKMWKSLLFVDNLIDNGGSMCMGWGWYLQNDMQIFVYSLLILMIYRKSRYWSFMLTFISIILSFGYTMLVSYTNEYKYTTHMTDFQKYGDYMGNLYIKPWSRCPPYLFGLVLGMLYVEFLVVEKKQEKKLQEMRQNYQEFSKNEKIQKNNLLKMKHIFINNPWKRRLVQFIGILICTFVILIPRTAQGDDHHWNQLQHSLFLTYSKLLFIIGVALIILPSLLGAENLIRFFLDTKAFNLVAKISFWTYLIHLTVMYQWIFSIKLDFYYAFVPLFGLFVSIATISMTLGLFFCVTVEIPFAKLQKQLLAFLSVKVQNKKKGKRNKDQNNQNSLNSLEAPIPLNTSQIK